MARVGGSVAGQGLDNSGDGASRSRLSGSIAGRSTAMEMVDKKIIIRIVLSKHAPVTVRMQNALIGFSFSKQKRDLKDGAGSGPV